MMSQPWAVTSQQHVGMSPHWGVDNKAWGCKESAWGHDELDIK